LTPAAPKLWSSTNISDAPNRDPFPIVYGIVDNFGNFTPISTNRVTWTGPRAVGRQKIVINVPTSIEVVTNTPGGIGTLSVLNTNNGTFTLTATASNGWRFVGWRGDVGGDWATMTVVARGQKVITPVFQREETK
jgi:hypothetical protein